MAKTGGPVLGENLIETHHLQFDFGADPVLTDINLTVRYGEIIGVIGPNGSGKSTLLRLLGGILNSKRGSVNYKKQDITSFKKRELAQHICWIPQETQLAFSFSVEEVVTMGRHPYRTPFSFENEGDRKIVERAMQITEITSLAARPFRELSGGEKQRVMIASAISQDPHLMLLDEPTAALDLKYQLQVLEILSRLNLQRGLTLLLAMHDLHLASKFCHRLILLKKGHIVRDGTPGEVLQKEILEEVYGTGIEVIPHPTDGSIFISPEAL